MALHPTMQNTDITKIVSFNTVIRNI